MTTLSHNHSFSKSISFYLRSNLLIAKRLFINLLFIRSSKFDFGDQLVSAPLISFSESGLWNKDDNAQNWILTAGKIQNLRIAAQKLNGLEIPSNTIFSFWKHVGKPSAINGYVIGREIREGCMVSTIAGGLCQLSNALYDAALKANFEIIERHKHTQVVSGSLAEKDRDAAVKWNYIDLQFRSVNSFRIVIDFTAQDLLVKFHGIPPENAIAQPDHKLKASLLNDCYSCGNLDCYKNPTKNFTNQQRNITTFILDEMWPEFGQYIKNSANSHDFFIVPFTPNSKFKINRFTWDINDPGKIKAYSFIAAKRSVYARLSNYLNFNLPAAYLKYDDKIITDIKNLVPIETTHIVISQNLLPHAWKYGLLWGRTYDVLMTRLPMEKIHERLSNALSNHTESKTLDDFRAEKDLVDLENVSLTKARRIITPHTEIAGIFKNKCVKLEWQMPIVKPQFHGKGPKILFPASALARKGAYEVRRLAIELSLDICVNGKTLEDAGFWKDVNIQQSGSNLFEDVGLVIIPAYIEHQPRLILRAIALNIPVIATTACGIKEQTNLTIIPPGDYESLKKAVTSMITQRSSTLQ